MLKKVMEASKLRFKIGLDIYYALIGTASAVSLLKLKL